MRFEDTIDLTDELFVKRLINDINSPQNIDRKTEDYDSYQIIGGNQRQYVAAELKRIYPESHKIMQKSNVNILKKP